MKKIKEPKDLGLKIGTKEESFWTGAKKQAEQAVIQGKHEIEINLAIIKLAEAKITEEQKV